MFHEPQPSQTDGVRQLAREILQNTQLLVVNDQAVESTLLDRLITFRQQHPETKDYWNLKEFSLEKEIGLRLFFNAVNFCYKDPDSGQEYQYVSESGKTISRSTGLFFAMKESAVDWNNLEAVAALTEADWLAMTQMSDNNPLYEGVDRIKRIAGLAKFLLNLGCDGTFDLMYKSNHDAQYLLEILDESGFFTDEFLKRAQLAVQNINEAFTKRNLPQVKNTDTLTCMADYRLPQVLYNLGVVELSEELEKALENHDEIKSGSNEERALRASCVVVGERLAELMGINEAEVDGLLWFLSQEMAKNGEMRIPHMIAATDKY